MGTEFSLRGSHGTRLSHPLVYREQRVTGASSRHVTFSGTKWSGWEPTHRQLLTGSVVNLSPRLKWKPGIWARQSHQTHESVRQLKQGLRNKKMHSTLPTPPPFKEIVHVHSGIRRAHPKSDSGRSESAFEAWVVNRHFCWQDPH